MVKARQSKETVMEQIKKLHNDKPIKLYDNIPASVNDLQQLLNRLAEYDVENKPATRIELKLMFNKLTKHYEGAGSASYAT